MAGSSGGTRPWWTLLAVSLGGMMAGLDGTALTIAGPDIARSVGASLGELQWIANAYLLALAVCLLPAGRLADRFGRRATFLAGILGFGLVSLLLAMATTGWLLIALRAAQGVCGALLQPAALALLRDAFPRERLELALGIWGGASAVSIAAGPIVAGVLVSGLGWPWVFLINVPVALGTAALARWAVTESRAAAGRGRSLGLLRVRAVSLGAGLTAISYFSLFGLLFFLTLYLQNLRGLDPVRAGQWLLPVTAVIVLSAPLGGALTGRFGPRWPATGGLVLIAAGMFGFSGLTRDSSQAGVLPFALALGLGTGIALIATTQVIVAGVPAEESGSASALQQVATQLGGVLGIAVLGAVMSWQVTARLADATQVQSTVDGVAQGQAPAGLDRGLADTAFMAGFHSSVLVATAVVLAGAALALFLAPARARALN
ncbi:MFS transporter [Amycolatopsis nigrescens]|uniref:MFS transporter n=1 Tax=Amycolatopsis nigrescens TaxID=381445 RepID=UPI00038074DD|nr:MFS transporter [Amycolatopsis nigrescens]